jgi:hypothetical protein
MKLVSDINYFSTVLMKSLLVIFCLSFCLQSPAATRQVRVTASQQEDRAYWADKLYQLAEPVLSRMSRETLQQEMIVEVSPTWDGRNKKVAYMEAFGRLMAGLAPWLNLPDDATPEGVQRRTLRNWALQSYAHAVDPASPDCLLWQGEGQVLVDAAFIALSFIRAPQALWEPLDSVTKQRYIAHFKSLRTINPPYTNWLLFSAACETFLLMENEAYDAYRIDMALKKINEWYVGDGWYSDGPEFAFDYYNSYVIQPFTYEILEVLKNHPAGIRTPDFNTVERRMQRYASLLERFVSPEGTFPVFGRSITYRLAVFQPLALLAWRDRLPEGLPRGQARAAMTAVMKRLFAVEGNFTPQGFLAIGLAGSQPEAADRYIDTGSEYLTTVAFLPLGLPANHPFWTEPGQDWTSRKAWSGKPFRADHAVH